MFVVGQALYVLSVRPLGLYMCPFSFFTVCKARKRNKRKLNILFFTIVKSILPTRTISFFYTQWVRPWTIRKFGILIIFLFEGYHDTLRSLWHFSNAATMALKSSSGSWCCVKLGQMAINNIPPKWPTFWNVPKNIYNNRNIFSIRWVLYQV